MRHDSFHDGVRTMFEDRRGGVAAVVSSFMGTLRV